MSRWLLSLGVVVLLAIGGWWWAATAGLERSMTTFWDIQRNDGLVVNTGEITRGGFPLRIAATQSDIEVSDPEAQIQLVIPAVTLSSPIYWPGDATLTLPPEPVTATLPEGTFTLMSSGMGASVELHPGSSLELEALTGSGNDISLNMVEGRLFSLESLQADVRQAAARETYDFDLEANGFAFGSVIKQALQMPVAWADAFEPIVADMTVTFDRPWNIEALAQNRPQPRRVQIDKLTAVWAEIGIQAAGVLDVDQNGVPEGTIRLGVQNWQRLFDTVVASTQAPTGWQSTVEQVLGAMADSDGTLDLPITMSGGQMRVGFFPLGPAPLLIIR